MQISNDKVISKRPFTGFYDITQKVQENTLLNRGIVDIGGCAIPQAIMSNNKDEAIERFSMSCLYFFMSIVTPFFMLPFLNKHFLASSGIVKNFKSAEKDIMKVSKKYLTEDGKYLAEGIKKKGLRLDAEKIVKEAKKQNKSLNVFEEMEKLEKSGIKAEHQIAFDNLLERFKGREEELREKLVKVHQNVFKFDFLSTAWMWCATPYIATGITEKRTHKKGFSAAFDMVDQSKFDEKKYEADKRKKLFTSALIATIPPLIAPKLIMKSMTSKSGALKKYASNFNYTDGMFMSKSIFALMWLLCDYPSQLVGSRDKLEMRDRAIRGAVLFTMFFGGDFALNNIIGRSFDKFAGTKIMDRKPDTANLKGGARVKQFFKDFKLLPRNFADLGKIDAPLEAIIKTKKFGTGLYWFALLANCGLIGFAMPAVLNKMLRKSVHKENISQNRFENTPIDKKSFAKFGF